MDSKDQGDSERFFRFFRFQEDTVTQGDGSTIGTSAQAAKSLSVSKSKLRTDSSEPIQYPNPTQNSDTEIPNLYTDHYLRYGKKFNG